MILDGPPTQASRSLNTGDFGPGFIDMLHAGYVLEGGSWRILGVSA